MASFKLSIAEMSNEAKAIQKFRDYPAKNRNWLRKQNTMSIKDKRNATNTLLIMSLNIFYIYATIVKYL